MLLYSCTFIVGFSTTSLEVAEPDGNTPTQVALVVQRVGGAVGVVEVSWNVTSVDGSPVSNDVIPVSGTLQFVSNSRQQSIRLSVLPDQTPELAEVRALRLLVESPSLSVLFRCIIGWV